jgi:hypothetical protein
MQRITVEAELREAIDVIAEKRHRTARETSISSQQSRAARGLLDWKLADLAAASGLGLSTIKHFEVSVRRTTRANLMAIRDAFEQAGVIFESDGESVGVKLKISVKSNEPRPIPKFQDRHSPLF